MQEVINEPISMLREPSCIDQFFVSQSNLAMILGVHSTLRQKPHYQITWATFNRKINYPPPYEQEIWHFLKQSSGGVLWKICSQKFRKIFVRAWHRCFAVNFAKFLRAPFLEDTSGRLLRLFKDRSRIILRKVL